MATNTEELNFLIIDTDYGKLLCYTDNISDPSKGLSVKEMFTSNKLLLTKDKLTFSENGEEIAIPGANCDKVIIEGDNGYIVNTVSAQELMNESDNQISLAGSVDNKTKNMFAFFKTIYDESKANKSVDNTAIHK